jgi:cytidylate kinase
MSDGKVVITLSRQVGTRGASIGQKVARRLGFRYLDREILRQAAQLAWQDAETLQSREERIGGLWENVLQVFSIGTPEAAYPLPGACQHVTDRDLFELEADVIRKVASQYDAVVVGRAGFWVLRDHPGLRSIFLHADTNHRAEHLRHLLNLPGWPEALQKVKTLDREREKFIRTMTGANWRDPDNYHLCIDSGRIPEATIVDIVVRLAESTLTR